MPASPTIRTRRQNYVAGCRCPSDCRRYASLPRAEWTRRDTPRPIIQSRSRLQNEVVPVNQIQCIAPEGVYRVSPTQSIESSGIVKPSSQTRRTGREGGKKGTGEKGGREEGNHARKLVPIRVWNRTTEHIFCTSPEMKRQPGRRRIPIGCCPSRGQDRQHCQQAGAV